MSRLASLATLVVGAFLAVAGLWALRLENESTGWPTTKGRVQSADLESELVRDPSGVTPGARDVKYLPRITYVYSVRGILYTNHRYSLEDRYSSEYSARAILRKHPPQHEVMVHYRPHAPAESVLVPGVGRRSWMTALAGIGCVVYGGLHWWRATRRKTSGYDPATPA